MPTARDTARIILSGYYGYNNLGDEAILTALVQQLRALAPDVAITALSADPAGTRRTLGIDAVHRMDALAIARAMRQADVFASGGGSLLQDVTGLGSVPYYLGLVKLAQALGTRTMFLAQGVGPLNHALSRHLVGRVARSADALAVRDTGSRDLLVRCGVPPGRIALTADPVLALAPASREAVAPLLRGLGLEPGRPTIGVALRPWRTWYERQLKAFSAVLAQEALARDAQILLLPFHQPDDLAIHAELNVCLEARPGAHRPRVATLTASVGPAEMMGLLGALDLMIGMRLHALIMAAAVATPAIGLVYDPKVAAFAGRVGFATVDSITAIADSTEFEQLLASVWENREAHKAALEATLPALKEEALKNAELALALAGRPRGGGHD